MVRHYQAKRTRHKNPQRRWQNAARLREQGLSLRQIAAELRVDEKTVRNDLKNWAELNAANNVTELRTKGAEFRPAVGGKIPRSDSAPDAGANVISLRGAS